MEVLSVVCFLESEMGADTLKPIEIVMEHVTDKNISLKKKILTGKATRIGQEMWKSNFSVLQRFIAH